MGHVTRRGFALALCCIAASWSVGGAGLQAAHADPPAYADVIAEAVAEFQAGHWLEARALFEQAHAIDPNAAPCAAAAWWSSSCDTTARRCACWARPFSTRASP